MFLLVALFLCLLFFFFFFFFLLLLLFFCCFFLYFFAGVRGGGGGGVGVGSCVLSVRCELFIRPLVLNAKKATQVKYSREIFSKT